jgi:uncharacterized repeat protein (TIGR01451 family)
MLTEPLNLYNGKEITFSIDATNNGTINSNNTFVSFNFPNGVSYKNSSLPAGTTWDNVSKVWDIGLLTADTTITATLTVVVDDISILEARKNTECEKCGDITYNTINWEISNSSETDLNITNNEGKLVIQGVKSDVITSEVLTSGSGNSNISASVKNRLFYLITDINSGGDVKTLPDISTLTTGQIITIKDTSGNAGTDNITIETFSTETIDGALSYVINTDYGSINLLFNGINYSIV